jgi:hypothetical protein
MIGQFLTSKQWSWFLKFWAMSSKPWAWEKLPLPGLGEPTSQILLTALPSHVFLFWDLSQNGGGYIYLAEFPWLSRPVTCFLPYSVLLLLKMKSQISFRNSNSISLEAFENYREGRCQGQARPLEPEECLMSHPRNMEWGKWQTLSYTFTINLYIFIQRNRNLPTKNKEIWQQYSTGNEEEMESKTLN